MTQDLQECQPLVSQQDVGPGDAKRSSLRQIADFYRGGVANLRRGRLGVGGWFWFSLLCLAVLGDEATTGYMITHGFSEGNPVAAAGFGGVGFAVFAIFTGVIMLVVLAPLVAARSASKRINFLRWVAYFCVTAKALAVVNNIMVYEYLWHGVRFHV